MDSVSRIPSILRGETPEKARKPLVYKPSPRPAKALQWGHGGGGSHRIYAEWKRAARELFVQSSGEKFRDELASETKGQDYLKFPLEEAPKTEKLKKREVGGSSPTTRQEGRKILRNGKKEKILSLQGTRRLR